MRETDSDIGRQALAWLVKTNDPEFEDWEEFTLWLERDPAHSGAYHRKADAAERVMPLVEQASKSRPIVAQRGEAPKIAPSSFTRRRVSLVLGALGALAVTGVLVQQASPVTHQTGAGEVRTVMLGREDRLVLNGDTKLEVGGLNDRYITLVSGEVLLLLRDAKAAPVKVSVGNREIVDVGTVFSVSRDNHRTRIAVAEGEVAVDPSGANLHVPGGMRLEAEDGERVLKPTPVDPSSVGAWRGGQLAYTDERVSNVLADLTRSTGINFRAEPSLGQLRFTGTLSLEAVKNDPRSLAPLLAVRVTRTGNGWELGDPKS